MNYVIQCVSGLQDVVAHQLIADFPGLSVRDQELGFLVVTCAKGINIAKVDYVNSAFLVLDHVATKGGHSHQQELDQQLQSTLDAEVWHRNLVANMPPMRRTFRVMCTDSGSLVSCGHILRERWVSETCTRTGMSYSPRHADLELWAIRRKSGHFFLTLRLPRKRLTEKDITPGELRPELAHLLCVLSEPQARDVFLDPFSGSGAISLARSSMPYQLIFASDNNPDKILQTKMKTRQAERRGGGPIIVRQSDARHLLRIEDNFIDAIVTDPPWGDYTPSGEVSTRFYREMMCEFVRITKPGARIVTLLGRREDADDLTARFLDALAVNHQYEILVNGKKAVVTVWLRLPAT